MFAFDLTFRNKMRKWNMGYNIGGSPIYLLKRHGDTFIST